MNYILNRDEKAELQYVRRLGVLKLIKLACFDKGLSFWEFLSHFEII